MPFYSRRPRFAAGHPQQLRPAKTAPDPANDSPSACKRLARTPDHHRFGHGGRRQPQVCLSATRPCSRPPSTTPSRPPAWPDDEVLFQLPITKHWLKQAALALTAPLCHSSYRGVHEFCRDLLGVNVSIGTVHNVVRRRHRQGTYPQPRPESTPTSASPASMRFFKIASPFSSVPTCISTYCFLLSAEKEQPRRRHLGPPLDGMPQDRGFAPDATIADFGTGIRPGQKRAMPGTPCRGDVFHARHELTPVVAVAFLENRACDAITAHDKLERQKTKLQQQGRRDQRGPTRLVKPQARRRRAAEQTKAIALADDVAVLAHWLGADIFPVSRCCRTPDRYALFDFLVAERQSRACRNVRIAWVRCAHCCKIIVSNSWLSRLARSTRTWPNSPPRSRSSCRQRPRTARPANARQTPAAALAERGGLARSVAWPVPPTRASTACLAGGV